MAHGSITNKNNTNNTNNTNHNKGNAKTCPLAPGRMPSDQPRSGLLSLLLLWLLLLFVVLGVLVVWESYAILPKKVSLVHGTRNLTPERWKQLQQKNELSFATKQP